MSAGAKPEPEATAGGAAALADAKRRFSRNTLCNVAGFAAQILSGFLVTPILVHGLGNVEYGIWGLVGQIVNSMDLLDFGLGIAVDRYLARHHARNDRAAMTGVISTGFAIAFVPMLIVVAAGCALAAWAPHYFKIPASLDRQVRVVIVLIALSVGLMFPGGVLNSPLGALSRYDLLTLRNTLWIGARLGLYWLVLRAGGGLVGVAAVALGVEVAALALGAYLASGLLPWLRLRVGMISSDTLRTLLSFSSFAFLLTVASRLIFSCDNIVVGWALGPLAVAFYAVAGGLAEQLRQSTKILTRLYSILATQMHALESAEGLQNLLATGSRLAFLLVLPGCVGLCLLGPQFLQLWLGTAYRQNSSGILVLLTVTVASFALATSCTQVLYGMNKHPYNALISIAEAAVNVALSILLVRRMGAIGVAWGTALPALAFEAGLLPWFTARQVGLRLGRYYQLAMLRPLLAGAPLLLWCWAWRASGRVGTWPVLFAVAGGGLLLYGVAARIYGLAEAERTYLRRTLGRLPPRVQWLLAG